MLQPTQYYYPSNQSEDTSLPSYQQEQLYAIRKEFDAFLGKLFFDHDENKLDRVLWTPVEYSIYRRMEQLENKAETIKADQLQLPFATYFRDAGWVPDDRPGAQQLSSVENAIKWGPDNTGVQAQAIGAQRYFNGSAFFSSYRDVNIAQERLFWMHNRRWDGTYAMFAGGTKVLLPLIVEINAYEIRPESEMQDFLSKQDIHMLDYSFLVRTPLVKIPFDQPGTYFTKEVAFYFHNREFSVDPSVLPESEEDWMNMADDIMELSEADELPLAEPDNSVLQGLSVIDVVDVEFTIGSDTGDKSAANFTWDYSKVDAEEEEGVSLPSFIVFYVHKGNEIETFNLDLSEYESKEELPTSYRIPGLSPGSVYDVAMLVYRQGPAVDKLHFRINTPDLPDRTKGLRGLKGTTL